MQHAPLDLTKLYRRLYGHFGPQHWWPSVRPPLTTDRSSQKIGERRAVNDKRFEMCIGAILTQNTAWTNVEKALRNLDAAHLLTPHALLRSSPHMIRNAIRPAGYFNQKTRKLRLFSHTVITHDGLDGLFERPLPDLRRILLDVWGIGRETADSIILYAAKQPIFVIDAYTKRLLACLGIQFSDYDEYRTFFESQLPRRTKLWNEYHALIVAWAKYYARDPKSAYALLGVKRAPIEIGARSVTRR